MAAEETVRARQREAQSCLEALQSLEQWRNFYENELFVREQEIDGQLQRVTALRGRAWRGARRSSRALQTQLRERDTVIVELKAEIASRDAALNERAAELERLRAASHDSGRRRSPIWSGGSRRRRPSRPPAERGGASVMRASRRLSMICVRPLSRRASASRSSSPSRTRVMLLRTQLAERAGELSTLAGALQSRTEARRGTRERVACAHASHRRAGDPQPHAARAGRCAMPVSSTRGRRSGRRSRPPSGRRKRGPGADRNRPAREERRSCHALPSASIRCRRRSTIRPRP